MPLLGPLPLLGSPASDREGDVDTIDKVLAESHMHAKEDWLESWQAP